MAAVSFAPRALDDLDEIRAWIGADNPEAADAMVDGIVDRVLILAGHPLAGAADRRLGRDVRRLVEPPYLILYRQEGEEVLVLRVLHGARRITRALLRDP